MRILPKSAKGTWLLTAAAWVSVCSVAWSVLPPRPLASAKVAGSSSILAVGPGGRAITFATVNCGGRSQRVELLDSGTAFVRTIFPNMDILSSWEVSPDGRWLAVDGLATSPGVHLVELTSGADAAVGQPGTALVGWGLESFSPDSSLWAFGDDGAGRPHGIHIWDAKRRRPSKFLAGEWERATFSRDGRCLIVTSHSQNNARHIVVWEVSTGQTLAKLDVPWCASLVTMTPDRIGVVIADDDPRADGVPLSCACLDVAGGRQRWSMENVFRCRAIAGGRRLMVAKQDATTGQKEVVVVNSNDGRIVSAAPLDAEDGLIDFSPDGLTWITSSHSLVSMDAVWTWLASHGLLEPRSSVRSHLDVHDAATGERLFVMWEPANSSMRYAPDGKALAVLGVEGDLTVWDIPPRTPVARCTLAAGILALPMAGFAGWRSRRLRRRPA